MSHVGSDECLEELQRLRELCNDLSKECALLRKERDNYKATLEKLLKGCPDIKYYVEGTL